VCVVGDGRGREDRHHTGSKLGVVVDRPVLGDERVSFGAAERGERDGEIDRRRSHAQVTPVDDRGGDAGVVDEHVARVQVAVAEHRLVGRRTGGRAGRQQVVDRAGRGEEAEGGEIGQDLAGAGGAVDGVGAPERVDRQVRHGGQGVQLGDEPAHGRGHAHAVRVGADGQLGAR
jgi:hypothetical protein